MKIKSYQKLLIALILGIGFGIFFRDSLSGESGQEFIKNFIDPVGQLFLRSIFMIVVPMVFSGLVAGVYELASGDGLKKIVRRTITFTVISSVCSVFIGVGLVNIVRPGDGYYPDDGLPTNVEQVEKIKSNVAQTKNLSQIVIELVPRNPIASAAQALEGEMVAFMVFALIFGIALAKQRKGDRAPAFLGFVEEIYHVCMSIVTYVMKFAPIAVFCLVFSAVTKHGAGLLYSLVFYVGVVVMGLLIQNFGVYSVMLKLFSKKSPLEFFAQTREVLMYAFATASSNATLPKSLETATGVLKLSPRISRFVLTVGSTANQNGTALFEGITVLFLAQVYNVDLSYGQQFLVIAMSVIAGIGTAGVPGGSLPLIMILLQQVGIPAEGLGLVLGVDRFLDMCRTAVNVSGDLVIAQVVDQKDPA